MINNKNYFTLIIRFSYFYKRIEAIEILQFEPTKNSDTKKIIEWNLEYIDKYENTKEEIFDPFDINKSTIEVLKALSKTHIFPGSVIVL